MAETRELPGRVISFDRSRARGIVDLGDRAVVVDASIVDASHLVSGDAVSVVLDGSRRVVAVRLVAAAREVTVASTEGPSTRSLFGELLDAQPHAPPELVHMLAIRDDIADHVRAWLARWDRPIRFWEPDNVGEVVDRRKDDPALTRVLRAAVDPLAPAERLAWLEARLRIR